MIKFSVRSKSVLLAGSVLAAIVLYPWSHSTASAYVVTVCDEAGHGVGGVTVNRNIEDYSFGQDVESSISETTDLRGQVHFPQATRRLSIAEAIFGCTKQIIEFGAHASCGSYSDITAESSDLIETARSERSSRLGQKTLKIVVGKCPSGDYRACRGAL